jgi:fumarate reductase flavoprotein subunit
MNTDVVVIGGAGSGLCAALRAAENGARVCLVEKMSHLGGSTVLAAGFFGIGSPSQKRLGIFDTPDDCYKEVMQLLYWNVDARLVRNWMQQSGESIRWLEEKGVVFDQVVPFQAFTKYARSTYHISNITNQRTGMSIYKTLEKHILEHPNIEVCLSTRATHILKSADGTVHGITAEQTDTNDGVREIRIEAKAVIIASGSVSGNSKLIERFFGTSYDDIQIMARLPHNQGEGLVMAEEIGAKIGNLGALYIGPHNHFRGGDGIIGAVIRRPESLKVNQSGERFADESLWHCSEFGWMMSVAINHQYRHMSWCIFDQTCIDKMVRENKLYGWAEYLHAMHTLPKFKNIKHDMSMADDKLGGVDKSQDLGVWLENMYNGVQREVNGERARICQTVGELAERIGCSERTLQETIDRYNFHCERNYDNDFLKKPDYLMPVSTPPYYIFNGPGGIDTCVGGINVNYDLKVINPADKAIPGLYAAGVCCSNWLNGGYAYYGSCLGFSLFSGQSAGTNAAKYSQGI